MFPASLRFSVLAGQATSWFSVVVPSAEASPQCSVYVTPLTWSHFSVMLVSRMSSARSPVTRSFAVVVAVPGADRPLDSPSACALTLNVYVVLPSSPVTIHSVFATPLWVFTAVPFLYTTTVYVSAPSTGCHRIVIACRPTSTAHGVPGTAGAAGVVALPSTQSPYCVPSLARTRK